MLTPTGPKVKILGGPSWPQKARKSFVLRLVKDGYVDGETAHTELSKTEQDRILEWIEQKQGEIRGYRSGLVLKFFSLTGMAMFSPDREDSSLKVDENGQKTVRDAYCWNRYLL